MSEKLNENRLMKSIISALIKGKGKQAAAIASKVNPGIGKKVLSLVKDLADLKKDIDDIKKRKPNGRYDHLGI